MNHTALQKQMLSELINERLFEKAEKYGIKYLKQSLDRNVYPSEEALNNLNFLEESFPQKTGDAEEILEILNKYGSPATVSQVAGRYFGFVNGSVVPAGLLAKNLSIFWDQNTAMQVISPISSKLEVIVQKWLVDLFGLADHTVAGFVSGTSMANFCGLAAARFRILKRQNWDIAQQGMSGAPKIRVVTCTQAHSTVLKAISLLGFGKNNVEWVDVDDQGRILVDEIPMLDSQTILILQAGNVNSGAYDNFESICEIARAKGTWIHIDGAFGLWAGATTRLSHLTKGFEFANSWAVDGHKTLNTPYDSGIVLCEDKDALTSALHMTGGYIIEGDERDGMYYTPEMSRRSRIIELWATLKYLGKNGIDQMVYTMHERAKQFAILLGGLDGFTVVNDIVFNQVLVHGETDEITDELIKEIQKIRECWVGGSTWKSRKVIRISVCSWVTSEEDVERSVESFALALQRVRKSSNTTTAKWK